MDSIVLVQNRKQSEPFPFGECHVCHDVATGVHYGVISCEGCKGFFKRYITQGVLHHCVFEGKCLVNTNTRNRCRSCRFSRCTEEGMSMENVKMGRIPKKIKEKVLRKHRKRQEGMVNVKLEDIAISSTDAFSHYLSLLRLPAIFFSFSSAPPPPQSIEPHNELSIADGNSLTVAKYISTVNENIMADYMHHCEMHYSQNILEIMKYFLPRLCQPFLLYELDYELMSFFHYIQRKLFDAYVRHTARLRRLIRRMIGIIELEITDYPGVNATYEQMWTDIQEGMAQNVREFLQFTQETPGLSELNMTDFTRIMNNRIFDFWIIMNYPLFYRNESYVMTYNGLQYSRHFMNKFIGKTTTDALHQFTERLHDLDITEIEHSLLIPIFICQSDAQFLDPETVHVIKHCYMFALYIQLCSTRTEGEAKLLFDNLLKMIDQIRMLNELATKNIGKLVIDKTCDDFSLFK